ncbi:MAG: polysaccharide biosynthesis C-terminal domain-containing protein [Bacteroidota bacterium]
MQKRFLSNALLVLVLNFTVKGTYLLIVEREVQNVLPRGEYGTYFSLLNLSLMFLLLADFGLQQYNNRRLSQHRHLLKKYFPYFFGLKLIFFVVFLSALLLGGYALGYDSPTLGLLAIVGLNIGLNSFLLFLRTNLSGLGFYRLDSWVSIADKTLSISLVGGLLLITPQLLNIFTFALAQSISLVIACMIVLRLLWPRLESKWPKIKKTISLSIMRRAWPYALAILLMAAYTRLDAVMIERLIPKPDGALQADHYAAAYRLLDAANMGGFLLAGLLLPMFSRLLSQQQSIEPLLRTATPLALTGAAAISTVLVCSANPITQLLYDFADRQTELILAWLIPSFIVVCGNYVYGSLCTAAGLLKPMNRIFLFGVILNFLGNLWVIPRYGAVGCAAVTTITQTFIAAGLILLTHRQLPISSMQSTWLKTILSILVLGVFGFVLPQVGGLSWWANGGLVLLLGLMLMGWHYKSSPREVNGELSD